MAIPPASRTYVVAALVSGTVIAAAVLLWVLEVITMPVFVGVIVVVCALEGLVFMTAARGTGERGERGAVHEPGAGGVGYDPMERFRP